MTPSEVITEARVILNDEEGSPRYSDAKLLVYVNDWAKQLARSKPSVFHATQSLALTASQETQEVSRSTTLGLADVLRTSGGARIRKVPETQIEEHLRFAYATGAYEPELWCPVDGDAWRFSVFPKPASASALSLVVKGDAAELMRAYGTLSMVEGGPAMPPIFNEPQSLAIAGLSNHQSVSRTATYGLVDVVSSSVGTHIERIDRALMDRLIRYGGNTEPVVWCPVEGDPWRFRVWPIPTGDTTVKGVLAINEGYQAANQTSAFGSDVNKMAATPDPAFNKSSTITIAGNTSHQEVSRTKTMGVVDLVENNIGIEMTRVSSEEMDALVRVDVIGIPRFWCPIEGDPWRFMIYPKTEAVSTLNVIVQSRKDALVASMGEAYMKKNDIPLPEVGNAALSFTMTSGSYHQEVSRVSTMGVVDVTANASGRPLRKVTREYIDDMMRNTFPVGTAPELWSPSEGDPWRFLVFPKPPGATNITVVVVQNPTDVALGSSLIPGSEYRASAAAYVAARALMANTSTADAPRASALFTLSATLAGTTF